MSYALAATQLPDDVDLVLDGLVAQGSIAWGELNYAGQTAEGRTDSLWLSGFGIAPTHYSGQYAVPLLGLGDAHIGSRGAGVVIAVIDTGIDATHPALAGAVSTQGVSFVAESTQWSDSGDGTDSDGDGLVDEQVGHGTFVAGLIRLVAPDAMLLPVRVLDSDGIANNFQIARAVAWSIDRGAHVVNMSLGEDYESLTIMDVVAEAKSKGVTVVGAAGNRATDDPKEYPASDPNAIGVTALDWIDARAPFANFGGQLDLSAPGASLVVGSVADLAKSIIGPVPGGGYAVWEGTSFRDRLRLGHGRARARPASRVAEQGRPDWTDRRHDPDHAVGDGYRHRRVEPRVRRAARHRAHLGRCRSRRGASGSAAWRRQLRRHGGRTGPRDPSQRVGAGRGRVARRSRRQRHDRRTGPVDPALRVVATAIPATFAPCTTRSAP